MLEDWLDEQDVDVADAMARQRAARDVLAANRVNYRTPRAPYTNKLQPSWIRQHNGSSSSSSSSTSSSSSGSSSPSGATPTPRPTPAGAAVPQRPQKPTAGSGGASSGSGSGSVLDLGSLIGGPLTPAGDDEDQMSVAALDQTAHFRSLPSRVTCANQGTETIVRYICPDPHGILTPAEYQQSPPFPVCPSTCDTTDSQPTPAGPCDLATCCQAFHACQCTRLYSLRDCSGLRPVACRISPNTPQWLSCFRAQPLSDNFPSTCPRVSGSVPLKMSYRVECSFRDQNVEAVYPLRMLAADHPDLFAGAYLQLRPVHSDRLGHEGKHFSRVDVPLGVFTAAVPATPSQDDPQVVPGLELNLPELLREDPVGYARGLGAVYFEVELLGLEPLGVGVDASGLQSLGSRSVYLYNRAVDWQAVELAEVPKAVAGRLATPVSGPLLGGALGGSLGLLVLGALAAVLAVVIVGRRRGRRGGRPAAGSSPSASKEQPAAGRGSGDKSIAMHLGDDAGPGVPPEDGSKSSSGLSSDLSSDATSSTISKGLSESGSVVSRLSHR
ncbi:hypothetical protein H696_05361 [Fonticula alba]|uniref:Uncharacterized protein n=1 Tax=Fonticula alba TaxID=691883 RepID=A0A058Z2F4_FONAL|nr:hypothetical protein H696_05361 [Fonticula alba]KCV68108.1 hypothetical protein H696_05361 [Fonticula alba]|eukprot:XP_009497482.1 hypothetical protein H696_05361 [Fonticula alba]